MFRASTLLAALLAAALVPAAVLAAPPGGSGPQDGPGGDSLEDLRARIARELKAQVAAVRPEVESLLAEAVDAVAAASPRRLAAARAGLAELPPSAALVLVETLEAPTEQAHAGPTRLAEAGRALRRTSSAAILGRLEALTASTDDAVRAHAIAALGAVPNRRGATRVLLGLFERRAGSDRAAVANALVQQGADDLLDLLLDAVETGDQATITGALSGARDHELDDADVVRFGRFIDALLANEGLRDRFAQASVDALAAHADLVEPKRVTAAIAGPIQGFEGALLLESVARLDVHRRHVQERLDQLAGVGDALVSTAALVALTRMGDRAAEKRLMGPLDEAVDEGGRNLTGALHERGRILTRTGEYADAINDLRKAVREAQDVGAYVQREINVSLAEAYLLNGRLDKAASSLEDAELSDERRQELARLELWRPLAEHHRYGEVLEPR